MKRFAIFLYVAAYLGLAGCSTDLATPGLIEARDAGGQVSGLWHSILRAGRLPAAPEQPQAQLTLSIPNQNWQAQFVPVAQKSGTITWQSTQAASVTTRDGIVIATRGLGDDLMSSETRDVAAALTGRGGTSGQREHHYLRGDGQDFTAVFICDFSRKDGVFIEDCKGARQDFVNRFPMNGAGAQRKSRQWLGPYLGYADLEWQP